MSRPVPAAIALLALLAWHAVGKGAALLPEMLWCCHLASLLVALGFLLRRPAWVGAFGVFHLAVGLPAWLLDVLTTGTTTLASVLLHLGTSAAGLRALRRDEVPRWTPIAAGSLVLVGIGLGRLAPEALNVNVAWRPYSDAIPIPLWLSHLGNIGLAILLSWTVCRVGGLWRGARQSAVDRPTGAGVPSQDRDP